jgi:hypothetical protein
MEFRFTQNGEHPRALILSDWDDIGEELDGIELDELQPGDSYTITRIS